jgi:hypothetical protein
MRPFFHLANHHQPLLVTRAKGSFTGSFNNARHQGAGRSSRACALETWLLGSRLSRAQLDPIPLRLVGWDYCALHRSLLITCGKGSGV